MIQPCKNRNCRCCERGSLRCFLSMRFLIVYYEEIQMPGGIIWGRAYDGLLGRQARRETQVAAMNALEKSVHTSTRKRKDARKRQVLMGLTPRLSYQCG